MAESERARRFRSLAEELRAVADDMRDAKSRERFVRMAENYEHLADVVEATGLADLPPPGARRPMWP
jgi:hypothetical protein